MQAPPGESDMIEHILTHFPSPSNTFTPLDLPSQSPIVAFDTFLYAGNFWSLRHDAGLCEASEVASITP